MESSEGTLFVVATPIGNLGDLSPRAREVLAGVHLVAAEDTRVTGRLLSHFGIKQRQMALHEHNEERQAQELVALLKAGHSIALVSDAGTPLVSDPGFNLIRAVRAAGITVTPIPGPSALLAALSVSGLPTNRFCFEGFLPSRGAARRQRLQELADEPRTLVFYEAVHRVAATVSDMSEVFGADRPATLGRELTKLYEQTISAPLGDLAERLADGRIPRKGEFVLVVAGSAAPQPAGHGIDADALLRELMTVLPGRQAVAVAERLLGENRNALYQRMLALKQDAERSKS